MDLENIIECHHCGLFLEKKEVDNKKTKVKCPRCNNNLTISYKHNLDSLYYAISSLLLFIILNIFPLISLEISGIKLEATLYGTVFILLKQNFFLVALIVFFTIFLSPLLNSLIIIISYIQSKTKLKIFNNTVLHDGFHFFRRWGFIEVFIISIIVTYIKLVGMISSTHFDIGFYVMIAYLFCFYMSNIRFEDKSVFGE